MTIPEIKEELIESIRIEQRRQGVAEYVHESWQEMRKENETLADSIFDSATNAARRIVEIMHDEVDPDDPRTEQLFFLVANNILGVSCALYKCIQQQMICNELSDS